MTGPETASQRAWELFQRILFLAFPSPQPRRPGGYCCSPGGRCPGAARAQIPMRRADRGVGAQLLWFGRVVAARPSRWHRRGGGRLAFVALSFLTYVASKRAGGREERVEGTTSSPLRMPVSSLGSAPWMVAPNPNSSQQAASNGRGGLTPMHLFCPSGDNDTLHFLSLP